ncbi:hypothetical protein [[Eubacterium] cellulosolvens]
MSSSRPTLFHMLEKLVGKRVLVVVERDFGYEGELAVVSHHPPGIWISEAEALVLRSTVVNPIPQVVSKEKKHELFLHLNSVLRIEAATESGKASEKR